MNKKSLLHFVILFSSFSLPAPIFASQSLSLELIQRALVRDFSFKEATKEKVKKKNLNVGASKPKTKTHANWIDSKKAEQKKWSQEKLKLIQKWQKDRARFLSHIDDYKKTRFDFSQFSKKSKVILHKEEEKPLFKVQNELGEPVIVKEALNLPIKDQGVRPTCAAFAGVRAVEILASQKKGEATDLSEQYFYYLSKPQCQQTPCSREGSWVVNGFNQLKSSHSLPSEENCPYGKRTVTQNQTQIPLQGSCNNGSVKVQDFEEITSLSSLKHAIDLSHPVIAAFWLNEAFYKNKGYVFESSEKKADKDHSNGHALLLVGYIDLPNSVHKRYGARCYLATNSWGEGWGIGGNSCLSSKWIEEHRLNMPFIELKSVSFNN